MDFEKAYRALNSRQRQAVDKIDGPLLVLAGPGTGKTQLLSARTANILKTTDTSPHEVLCLTFTDKAALNMKERMVSMIGPEASKVVVKTFHGLGSQIINENPDYFFNAATLDAAPEVVKLEILDDILGSLPLSNPLALRFYGQSTVLKDVLKAIQKSKEAGLTPGMLKAVTVANLAYLKTLPESFYELLDMRLSKKAIPLYREELSRLPTQDMNVRPIPSVDEVIQTSLGRAVEVAEETGVTKEISAWKQQWTEKVDGKRVLKDVRRNEWWAEVAEVYEQYQKELHTRGYFDFADMILEVIVQLQQNETLRNELQERFRYIMIDEFQDTNDAQFRLAYLLASHPAYDGSPNIMAVGDDDQAIYRFQGAEITNAQNFIDSFLNTKLIVLTDNYRSYQPILEAAQKIAGTIESRLVNVRNDISKDIVSQLGDSKNTVIEHKSYSTQMHEITGVAKHIKSVYFSKKGTIAVLARNHSALEKLAPVLVRNGVPVRYERKSNVMEQPLVGLVIDIIKLSRAMRAGQREIANSILSGLLHEPIFALDAKVLWRFAIDNKGKDADWLSALCSHSESSMKYIGEWLTLVAHHAVRSPVTVTIENIIGLRELEGMTSPLRAQITKNEVSYEFVTVLSALQSLRSLAAEFTRKQTLTLDDFLAYIEISQKHGVIVADESTFVSDKSAVELMTVYKAKGLEFDTVYVLDTVDSVWSPAKSRRKPPANLQSLQDYGEDSDDYGRLMFVASTRAKQKLYFTSFRHTEHGDDVLASPLVHGINMTKEDESGLEVSEVVENDLRWPELNSDDQRHVLAPLLENYELSVTHLLNFLDISRGGPQYFIERNLLRLPELKSPQLAFGTAMHAALRTAQLLTNANEFDLLRVKADFRKKIEAEGLEHHELERWAQKGLELLDSLFAGGSLKLTAGSIPERKISGVSVGNARIKGELDRIDDVDGAIRIIDYKTGGELKGQLVTTTKTEGLKALKHRIQLVFYTLLMDEKGLNPNNKKLIGQMVYVEAKEQKNFVREYEPTKEDIQDLRNLIRAVWRRIQAQNWPDISSYTHDLNGVMQFMEDLKNENV